MKEENKKCWSCGRYQAYYTKGYCKLTKENVGFCSLHNKIMEKNDCCNQWRYLKTLRHRRKMMAVSSIPDIRDKLNVIEEILKEDIDLEKLNNE